MYELQLFVRMRLSMIFIHYMRVTAKYEEN